MNMFTIYTIPPLISAILSIALGILVFSRNRKSSTNSSFLLLSMVTFWWQFSWFFLFNTESEESVGFLVRLGYIGIIFIPIVMYHFFLSFFEIKNKIERVFLSSLYVTGILFVYLLFSSDLLINGYYKYSWGYYPKAGILHPFYLLILTLLSARLLLICYRNLKAQKYLSPYKYQQIKYVFLALVFYIFAATDFLVNYGFGFYPFGFFFIFCFIGVFSYAIVVHRLMDIKLVMRSSSVYLASLITILLFAVIANSVFYKVSPNLIYWTNLFILILSISVFPAIKSKYFNWANLYFFSSLYDPQKIIVGLSDHLRTTLQIDNIYNYIYESLDGAFHFKSFGVLSYNESANTYSLDFNKGYNVNLRTKFFNNVQLYETFISRNKIMVTEELRKNYYNKKNKEVIDILLDLKIEILVPLNVKNRIVGLIALGPKESNDMYNDVDLQTLEIISAQAATAIENAHLYEKTLNFNLKLKDEVEKATRELVVANKKLIKLDEAKSEFISIASHQLRTPLTIIKGYISMILEGNFGELTPGEKDSLDKVYLSNERLIQLVENLLNISRIESGRLQFDYKEMQLSDIIDSVVEELEPKAKGKGLKFTYKKSKKKMPNINIDEEKIRQVVMNLIDNAIKYTKKGSVTVSLDLAKPRDPKMPMCLEFKVADSGMGISADDLPNLFKKFSRGTGSSLVHTEGTGLGLYVARQMIESHHGKIWAESIGENKGSKFCFRISLDNPEAKLVAEKKEEKKVKKVKG